MNGVAFDAQSSGSDTTTSTCLLPPELILIFYVMLVLLLHYVLQAGLQEPDTRRRFLGRHENHRWCIIGLPAAPTSKWGAI